MPYIELITPKMSRLEDGPTMWPARLQSMFFRICAVTSLILLVIYAVTWTDLEVKTPQSLESSNFSLFFSKAVYEFQKALNLQKIRRQRKLVLLWTDFFGEADWLPSTVDLHCPVNECDITSNHSLLLNSSAVVLHWRNIDTAKLPKCVPSETSQCPLWVLFNKEAPPHTPRHTLEAVQHNISWTATYRNDSDIFSPYGKIVQKKIRSSWKSDFNASRRPVCWLVSNCATPSKRELFVKELEKYITVDIYGKCGKMECPHKLSKDCYRWLSSRCKFYLSFENSICKDYTTEKLYNALSTDMVPVVLGNNSNYDHLPPSSYINAADFSSPKELAEYLVIVGKDKNLYKSYLWWKRDYDVIDQPYSWFCNLCEKLHNTELRDAKPDRNLVSWWFEQSECSSWNSS